MDRDKMIGRTPILGQMLETWRLFASPPTWDALAQTLGGLAESACLICWAKDANAPVIEQAGAQAVLAYGTMLAGAPADILTAGRADATGEAAQALRTGQPFTVEDTIGEGSATRRIARLYLPLDATAPAVACGIVRID